MMQAEVSPYSVTQRGAYRYLPIFVLSGSVATQVKSAGLFGSNERVRERRKTPQERSKRVQEALKRLSKRLSDAFSVEIPFWTPSWTPF